MQRQVETTRRRKLTTAQRAALARIEGLVEYWQISDLELALASEAPPARVQRSVKYVHPVTGESWDGEGEQPEWLRRALLKEGYLVSELRPPSQITPTFESAGR